MTTSTKTDGNFPLKLHKQTGQWRRYIDGKYVYFGSDRREALRRFEQHVNPNVVAPTNETNGWGVAALCNKFLNFRKLDVDQGKISQRQWSDLRSACEQLITVFGRDRAVESLTPEDFIELRRAIATNKNGTAAAPSSVKRKVANTRSIFSYALKKPLAE